MADDYIVDEVRRHREEQAAKRGFDVKAILVAAKKRQRRSGRTVVSFVQKETVSAALPHAPACSPDDVDRVPPRPR